MSRQVYINLAVRDLPTSKAFWAQLGFDLNPKLTDDKAACMILSDSAFVMLLAEPFFQGFTRRAICDTSKATETMLALSCPSREAVDAIVGKAIAAGGSHAMDKQDHGFMYGWSFYDPDGHHWEVMWMDPSGMPS